MASTNPGPRAVPRLAVWAVSILGTVLGVLSVLGGAVLAAVVDRASVASMVRSGQIRVDGLRDAQAVDLVVAVAWWVGVGLVVTGTLLVVAGVGYLLLERRLAGAETGAPATAVSLALFGAFATVFTSFLPASPLLGGGLAGYFRGGSRVTGATVGTLSGLVAVVPLIVLLGAVAIGVAVAVPARGLVGDQLLLVLVVGGSALFSVVVTVALGGVGGAIGSYVAADRRNGE